MLDQSEWFGLPVLFTLQQLAVCGNLELQSELGVHQVLQFLQDRLHLGAQLRNLFTNATFVFSSCDSFGFSRTDLVLEVGVLRLPLALLVLVLATHQLQLLLELSVL